MNRRVSQYGMTLIELMIVVAFIGLLSAVAYPSYQSYVQRSNRGAAKAMLEQAAQYMERQFTITNSYPSASTLASAGFDAVPQGATASEKKYTVSLGSGSSTTTFTLEATPSSATVDPTCGMLTLNNLGVRTSASGDAMKCWGR